MAAAGGAQCIRFFFEGSLIANDERVGSEIFSLWMHATSLVVATIALAGGVDDDGGGGGSVIDAISKNITHDVRICKDYVFVPVFYDGVSNIVKRSRTHAYLLYTGYHHAQTLHSVIVHGFDDPSMGLAGAIHHVTTSLLILAGASTRATLVSLCIMWLHGIADTFRKANLFLHNTAGAISKPTSRMLDEVWAALFIVTRLWLSFGIHSAIHSFDEGSPALVMTLRTTNAIIYALQWFWSGKILWIAFMRRKQQQQHCLLGRKPGTISWRA